MAVLPERPDLADGRSMCGHRRSPWHCLGVAEAVPRSRGCPCLSPVLDRLAGAGCGQESSFQLRTATHTMAIVVATSMTEK
jgi:hypothetical protein